MLTTLSFTVSPPFQLWIDNMNSAPSHSPEKKDSDFFTEHTQVSTTGIFPLINALLTKAVVPFCDHDMNSCV